MTTDPDPEELSPRELALLACYQDGTLGSDDRLEAERLLARSEAARETIAESSALLDPERGDPATPGGFESPTAQASTPAARTPSQRMGWRTFLPLTAAGVLGLVVFWPGRGPLNMVAWSDVVVRQGGGTPFTFPVFRGDSPEEDLAVAAGIRWVDFRIALRSARSTEADSLARALSTGLAAVPGSGPTRGRIEALVDRSPPPSAEELEGVQRALFVQLGPPFEETLVLATLRRAAGAGASELASDLVDHRSLNDGLGEDLGPEIRSRLLQLYQDDLTADELTEMEAIVTDVLRRRT